jgi:hypothetical protein
LVDHDTQEFLLCFSHDRLDRIEASVLMKAGEGPGVLAHACSLWLKNSAPSSGGNSCEGRDGDVAFSAHLGRDASADATGTASAAGSGVDFQMQPSILSLVLTQTADRGVSSAPEH